MAFDLFALSMERNSIFDSQLLIANQPIGPDTPPDPAAQADFSNNQPIAAETGSELPIESSSEFPEEIKQFIRNPGVPNAEWLDALKNRLVGTQFSVNDIIREILKHYPDFFRGANLANADLQGVDLSNTTHVGVNFSWANLINANFTDANFTIVDFTGANFTGANFTGANFEFVDLINIRHDTVSAVLQNSAIPITQKARELVQQGVDPRIMNAVVPGIFQYADLSDMNLGDLSFATVDLTKTNFTNALTSKTNFVGTALNDIQHDVVTGIVQDNRIPQTQKARTLLQQGVDPRIIEGMVPGIFRNSDLSGMQLQELNFSQVNLEGVDFTGTNLTDTKFDNVILDTAKLDNIRHDVVTAVLEDTSIPVEQKARTLLNRGVNPQIIASMAPEIFRNADLSAMDLNGLSFSRIDLTGANLAGANLTDINFTGANLNAVNLTNIRHDGVTSIKQNAAIFTEKKAAMLLNKQVHLSVIFVMAPELFPGADLSNMDLQGADFTGMDLTQANLSNTNLANTNLSYINLSAALLTGANLTAAKLSFANLTAAKLSDTKLTAANLSHAMLTNADLQRANLFQANLGNADLTGTILIGANLIEADLTKANLTDARFSSNDTIGHALTSVRLKNSNLTGIRHDGVDRIINNDSIPHEQKVRAMLQAGSEQIQLQIVYQLAPQLFRNADLSDIKFSADCSFVNADLTDSDLSRADLSGVDLTGAKLIGTNLSKANLSHAKLQEANLQNANLTEATLKFSNLQNTNLKNVNFYSADLQGANLANTDLRNVNLRSVNLQEANLEGVKLQNMNIAYINLQNANLKGANLQEAYIYSVNLSNALLTGANLKNANLQHLDLEKAQMQDVNLQNSNIQDVNFTNADLSNANLQEANLQIPNFNKANLRDTNFWGANLSRANFTDADLTGAILHNANLPESNFSGVDLRKTILQGANLSGVNLLDSKLLISPNNVINNPERHQLWTDPAPVEISADSLLPPGWHDYQNAAEQLAVSKYSPVATNQSHEPTRATNDLLAENIQGGISYAPELPGYGEAERLFGKDVARGLNLGPIEQAIPGFDNSPNSFPIGSNLDFDPNNINIPSSQELAETVQHTGHSDTREAERKLFDPNLPEFPLGREGDAGDNPNREILPDIRSLNDVANAVNALVADLRNSQVNARTLIQLQTGLNAIQNSMQENQQTIIAGFGKMETAAEFIYAAVLQQLQNAQVWANDPQRQTDIANLQQGAVTVLGGLTAVLLSVLDPRNWWRFISY